MGRLEEVKEILQKVGTTRHDICGTEYQEGALSIKQVQELSKVICSLFESKPDEGGWLNEAIRATKDRARILKEIVNLSVHLDKDQVDVIVDWAAASVSIERGKTLGEVGELLSKSLLIRHYPSLVKITESLQKGVIPNAN